MKILKASVSNSRPEGGYLYIFKHGLGPGTLPSDVNIIKTQDLPNYFTAVWLDRFLTADELKQYDIPSETEINRYLDQIGYCQEDGNIFPCRGVEACGDVMASEVIGLEEVVLHDRASTISIDMWFGDEFVPKKYDADAWFNDRTSTYNGWIYDDDGKCIGDYVADDSIIIEKNFKIYWD